MPDLTQLAAPGSPEEMLVRRLDLARLPRHVAVIMDGNGRWAKQRGRPRVEGHRAGVESVRDTVEASAQLGIEALTLYAFSIENWQRPKQEVWTLMSMIREFIRREIGTLRDNGIRVAVLGRREGLDQSLLRLLDEAVETCAGGETMTLNVALNYGGRAEIVDACRALVAEWAAGKPVDIDEETLGRYLYTAGQPDPDLLIRTSGEQRISNFLLWQIAYAELCFTPTLWPDFRRRHLFEALIEFQARDRRFGAVENTPAPAPAAARSPRTAAIRTAAMRAGERRR